MERMNVKRILLFIYGAALAFTMLQAWNDGSYMFQGLMTVLVTAALYGQRMQEKSMPFLVVKSAALLATLIGAMASAYALYDGPDPAFYRMVSLSIVFVGMFLVMNSLDNLYMAKHAFRDMQSMLADSMKKFEFAAAMPEAPKKEEGHIEWREEDDFRG